MYSTQDTALVVLLVAVLDWLVDNGMQPLDGQRSRFDSLQHSLSLTLSSSVQYVQILAVTEAGMHFLFIRAKTKIINRAISYYPR